MISLEFFCRMASRVLCATLAIPIPASRNAIDQLLESDEQAVDKQRRLAQLLMLQNPPKRTALIKDLVSCRNFSPFMLIPETTGAT
jgi:translation initiation factor 3 subunit A